MLVEEERIKKINEYLSILKTYVKMNTKINLNDICIISEDFFCGLLNLVFNLELVNANTISNNYEGIDLLDEKNHIVYQITADKTSKKIQKTLNSFTKIYDENYAIKFIIISDSKVFTAKFKIDKKYSFSTKEDIIFIDDFGKIIKNSNKINEVYDYFKKSFYIDNYNRSYDWYKSNNENSIADLGCRYNKEISIDVPIYDDLSNFIFYTKASNKLLQNIKKAIIETNGYIDKIVSKDIFVELKQIYINYINEPIKENLECLKDLLIKVYRKIIELKDNYVMSLDSNEQNNAYYNLNKLQEKYKECVEILDIATKNILIIRGKIGTGKSHLLASFIENSCISEKNEAIFILGQYLNDNKMFKLQIKEVLGINETFDELVLHLNAIGKEKRRHIPIFIDALNESRCKQNWKNEFNSIVNIISKNPYVKLVVSVRSDYQKTCLPDSIDNNACILDHFGFDDNVYKAMNEIFNYYNVPIPLFPIINESYTNPLFLTSVCRWIRDYKIDILLQDYTSFEEIFEKYIDKINEKIVLEYDFNSTNNLLDQILKCLTNYLIDNSKISFTKKEFCGEVLDILNMYGISPIGLLDKLKSEGLLFESIYGGEEILYFSYEQYISILKSKALINNISAEKIDMNMLKEAIFTYKYDMDILKNIFIIIGNEYGIEIYDIFTVDEIKNRLILDAYFESLVWRKKDNFDKKGLFSDFIVSISKNGIDLLDTCYNLFYYCCTIESSPFNIYRYNDKLLLMNMPERDSKFTINLNFDKSYKIINYCLYSNVSELNFENRNMLSIFLAWLFASPNRKIRDTATKALVNILTDNISGMIYLINNFKSVDDLYIMERIYGAVYGSLLRSEVLGNITDLVNLVYKNIFVQEEVVPNINIRYYAKNIIEYFLSLGLKSEKSDIKIEKITPPYNSKWYKEIPTNNDIKKYLIDYNLITKENAYLYSQNDIVHSMLTEDAKDLGMYGDFGRYNFGHRVSPWLPNFKSEQELSNIVIKQVFNMGYDVNCFGNYDRYCNEYSSDRHAHSSERIGKKYQWLAMYELIAKLQDNYPCYDRVYSDDEYDENTEYLDFEKQQTTDLNRAHYKKVDYLLENKYLLNIDVSNLLTIPKRENNFILEKITDDWLLKDINIYDYINVNNYISLSSVLRLESDDLNLLDLNSFIDEYKNKSTLDILFQAYLYFGDLNLDEFELEGMFRGVEKKKDYLLMEYPWLDEEDNEFNTNRDNCYITNYTYTYNSEYDNSEKSEFAYDIGIEQPSKYLINNLNLKQRKDGFWYDSNDELVCFDTVLKNGERSFLIDKNKLEQFLKEKKLNIVWMGYVEKKHMKKIREYRFRVDYQNNKVTKYDESCWDVKW